MDKAEIEETMSMIEDCLKRDAKMSTWECEFIESIKEQLTDRGRLSEKQLDRLDEIWEKVT